jgi:hypothetical protein
MAGACCPGIVPSVAVVGQSLPGRVTAPPPSFKRVGPKRERSGEYDPGPGGAGSEINAPSRLLSPMVNTDLEGAMGSTS